MSIRVMSQIIDHSQDLKVKGNELLALLLLADKANDEGLSWPLMGTLAAQMNIARKSVQRILGGLTAKGLIESVPRFTESGRQTSNTYQIRIPQGGGQLGGAPLTGGGEGDSSEALGGDSSEAPRTIKGNTNGKEKTIKPQDLEEIWERFPRKVGKGKAIPAIEKALKTVDVDRLKRAVSAFATIVKREKTEKRFIPHPATWLNGGRWSDEGVEEEIAKEIFKQEPTGDEALDGWNSHE